MSTTLMSTETLPMVGLPHEAYTAEQFQREIDGFWRRTWRFACHVSQIPNPGDWFRYDLLGDSVMVVRQDDGSIQAFHNVCRHRGAPLVVDETGSCGHRFVCPYHGWNYGRDGALLGTPRMNDVVTDRSPLGLRPAHVELWEGCVFVGLGPEHPGSIAEELAGVTPTYLPYDLKNTRVAIDRRHVVEANWKLLWENGLECYHCAINHPDIQRVVDVMERENRDETSLLPLPYNLTPEFPLVEGVHSVTDDGQIQSLTLGDPASPPPNVAFLSWHKPLFEIVASPDHAMIMTYHPITHTRSEIRMVALVHPEAQEGVHYDLERYFEIHWLTRSQDDALIERVQRGVSSPTFRPGPFHPSYEVEVRNWVRIYRELMGTDPDQEATA